MLIRTAILASLLLAIVGFALPVSAQTPEPAVVATPLIIDSDMTLDDWMATLYILNDPAYDVKAITVTGTGFAYCDAGVEIALGLLALTEYGDVPVSCWTETPLAGTNAPPAGWRVDMAMAEGLGLPDGGQPSELDAVQLFAKTITESQYPVEVLALGPLTNVGAAFEADSSLVGEISRMVVMGGAVDVPGSGVTDLNSTAEWNIYCDPHAARLVFESGVPITLVPLDATNLAPITPDFLSNLETTQNTPEATFVYQALSGAQESIEAGQYYFWDPLAAAVLADPAIVTLTERQVSITDNPGGAEDGRTKPVSAGSTILVATEPNVSDLETDLIDRWNT